MHCGRDRLCCQLLGPSSAQGPGQPPTATWNSADPLSPSKQKELINKASRGEPLHELSLCTKCFTDLPSALLFCFSAVEIEAQRGQVLS